MLVVVGRNDPCTCGSGKKYKKCCGKSNVVDISTVIEEELDRVQYGFFDDGLAPREYAEVETRIRKWNSAIRDFFEPDLMEALAIGTYIYLERVDLWRSHLKKQVNKQRRQQVIDVLTSWQDPFLLLGEVMEINGDQFIIRDEITDKMYVIPRGHTKSQAGDRLFGIVMPDTRFGENGIFGTSTVIFIPENRTKLIQQLREELMKPEKDYLDIYRLFESFDHAFDFTPFQQEVIDLTEGYLKENGFEEHVVIPLLSAFLLKNEVKAKKPSAVAAGVISLSYDINLIGPPSSTQKEIAAYFNVSPGTIGKYRDQVGDFMVETIQSSNEEELMGGKVPTMLTDMGTDPRGTERFMWEMLMRMQQQSFDDVESLNTFMKGKMNEDYEPANETERAQLLCYRAYEADTEELRVQLANEAASIHPDLTDVHLLLAEQSTNKVVIENHLLKALLAGGKEFDSSHDQTWNYVLNRPYLRALFSYGAWLMTEGRYEEAVGEFKRIIRLNSDDHQGASWLLMAAYMRLGFNEHAYQVLDDLNPDEDHAVAHYLETLIEKEDLSQDVYNSRLKRGRKLNEHVEPMLAVGENPGAFPQSLIIEPGNKDEARLIYWLVYGIM